jgi:TolA-binding protein
MAQPGKPSTAHQYGPNDVCYWCDMYKRNVLALSHVCTPVREFMSDANIKDVVTAKKQLALAYGRVESMRLLELFEQEKLRVKEEQIAEELAARNANGEGRKKPYYGVRNG